VKIFINKVGENWICDRFAQEWEIYNSTFSTNDISEANIIWLMASWGWQQIPLQFLKNKIVVTTIHHLDLDKFNEKERLNFQQRDLFTDFYHVPCLSSKQQIQNYTSKPIFVQPFWANKEIWFHINEKDKLRKEFEISLNKKIIGSFQRDTEGHDLKSPKLSKGPDIFCDIVEKINKRDNNVEVLLTGWRRQYVMNRLEKAGINYHYHNLVDFKTMNKLYNVLDLYIVSSRVEGGPQAVIECALAKTPIVSTDVGMSSLILSQESIYEPDNFEMAKPNTNFAYENAIKYNLPFGFQNFNIFFEKILSEKKK